MPILVIIESPYRPTAGPRQADQGWLEELRDNLVYARRAMHDSFARGEYPFASHLLYTQPGILDDQMKAERDLGIEAGLAWGKLAFLTAVYTDRGISAGMEKGIARAGSEGRLVDYRKIGK